MDLSPPFERLTGIRLDPSCADISPDGRWLALAERDPAKVCVFDVRAGRQVRRVGRRPDGSELDSVLAHAWSWDGRLAVVESGGAVYVWHPEEDEDLTFLTTFDLLLAIDPPPLGASSGAAGDQEEAFWTAAAWSPDGSMLAVASEWGQIAVLDTETGSPLYTCPPTDRVFEALEWSPDGQMIALGDEGGDVWVQSPAVTGAWTLFACDGRPYQRTLSWSQDGATLAASGQGATIRLINPGDGTEHQFLPQFPPLPKRPDSAEAYDLWGDHESASDAEEAPVLSALAFVQPGVLAVGLKDGRLCLVGPTEDTTVLHKHVSPVERIAPCGDHLVTIDEWGLCATVSTRTGQEKQWFLTLDFADELAEQACWDPSGWWIATGDRNSATVFDTGTGKVLSAVHSLEYPVEGGWDSDGLRFALWDDEGGFELYEPTEDQLLRVESDETVRRNFLAAACESDWEEGISSYDGRFGNSSVNSTGFRALAQGYGTLRVVDTRGHMIGYQLDLFPAEAIQGEDGYSVPNFCVWGSNEGTIVLESKNARKWYRPRLT